MTLLAEYGFNEGAGATAADSSGNSRDLTATGDPWTASGHTGAGIQPTGSAYMSIGDLGLGSSLTQWTLMGWFYRLGAVSSYGQFFFDSANLWCEITSVNTWGFAGTYSSSALPVNTWVHLAWVCDGTSVKCYQDGVLVATNGSAYTIDVGDSLSVGIGVDGPVNGRMDDARLFDTALTTGDIGTWAATPVDSDPEPAEGIAFKSAGTVAETSGTTLSVSVPTIALGDCAVVLILAIAATAIAAPTGWAEFDDGDLPFSTGGGYVRIFQSQNPAAAGNVVFTVPSGGAFGIAAVWSGDDVAIGANLGSINNASMTNAPSAALTVASPSFVALFGLVYAARLSEGDQATSGTITVDSNELRTWQNITSANFRAFIADALVATAAGGKIITDFSGSNTTSTVLALTLVESGGDTIAPSVSITQPTELEEVSGTITLSATVTDDVELDLVVADVDGSPLGAMTNTSGDLWEISLDTTALSNASHALKVTATDTSANESSDTVNVTVDNAPPAPVDTVSYFDGTTETVLDDATLRVWEPPFERGFWYGNDVSYWDGTTEHPITLASSLSDALDELSYTAYGDSYGVVQAGGSGAGVDYSSSDLFPQQLAAALSTTVTNRHVNSYMAMDVAYLMNLGSSGSRWVPGSFELVTIHCGGNDMKNFDTAAGLASYLHGIRAIIALTRMASRVTAQSATAGGTWSNTSTGTSGNARQSSSAGATLSFGFTGTGATLLLMAPRDGSGSSFTYTVDGGTPIAGTTVAQAAQNPVVSGSYGLVPITLRGLASSAHTVVVTKTGTGTLVADSLIVHNTDPADVPYLILTPPVWPINGDLWDIAGIDPAPTDTDLQVYANMFALARSEWADDVKVGAILMDSYREEFWRPSATEDWFIDDGYHPNKAGCDALSGMWIGNVRRLMG